MARQSKINPQLAKLLKRISVNVVQMRKDRGWTQEQAAERGGFDFRWYQRLESGKYSFSLETLVRLSELYKLTVAELVI